jgi:hypothetical protein
MTFTYALSIDKNLIVRFKAGGERPFLEVVPLEGLIIYDFYTPTIYELFDIMVLYYTGSKPYSSLGAEPIVLTNLFKSKDVLSGALNRGEDNNMVEVDE